VVAAPEDPTARCAAGARGDPADRPAFAEDWRAGRPAGVEVSTTAPPWQSGATVARCGRCSRLRRQVARCGSLRVRSSGRRAGAQGRDRDVAPRVELHLAQQMLPTAVLLPSSRHAAPVDAPRRARAAVARAAARTPASREAIISARSWPPRPSTLLSLLVTAGDVPLRLRLHALDGSTLARGAAAALASCARVLRSCARAACHRARAFARSHREARATCRCSCSCHAATLYLMVAPVRRRLDARGAVPRAEQLILRILRGEDVALWNGR